ncbi:MAG: hypothetical protein VX966_05905 [Chloroflexota bacterium]|nr:hypothetical protein [Chloroflexota bacterium]
MKYLSRRILLLATVLILTIVPIGCGGTAPKESPIPTLQSIPTAVPTNTIVVPPTDTPTSTPAPEPTQVPTPTTIVVMEPTPEPAVEPAVEPTVEPTVELIDTIQEEPTKDETPSSDSNSVADDAPASQQDLSESMSAAIAPLADKLIYLIHFDSKTKSWSVYDPTGSFVLEDLEPILMGPMPKSVESLTDIAINQPAYVKISAGAVFMGRALTEGYNLIVWKP